MKINDITLNDFYSISKNLLMNNIDDALAVTSRLTATPIAELKKLSPDKWLTLLVSIHEMVNREIHGQGEILKTITLNEIEYFLIEFETMTLGEFIDLDIVLNSPGAEQSMHKILSIIYRPKIDGVISEYDSDQSNERADDFLEMKYSNAKSVMYFFFSSERMSLDRMLDYFLTEVKNHLTPDQGTRLQKIVKESLECGLEF